MEKVPYVTSPGKRVTTLVSNMGLYRKAEAKGELILTGYFAAPERVSEGDKVREIREQCGWNLQVAGRLERIEPPIEDELRLLRLFDPHRQFLGK